MQSGLVPPCNSFSTARNRPGGPPPLKTNEEPYGLSDLRPSDAEKVRAGNVLAQFSLGVSEDCSAAKIPVTVENPNASRLATTRLRLENRPVYAATAAGAAAAVAGKSGYSHYQPLPALAAYRFLPSRPPLEEAHRLLVGPRHAAQ